MLFHGEPNMSKPEPTQLTRNDMQCIERGFKSAWQGKPARSGRWQYQFGRSLARQTIAELREQKMAVNRPWQQLRGAIHETLRREGYLPA